MRGKTFASLKIERPVAAGPGPGVGAGAPPDAGPAPVALSPFVEFSLQSVAAEGGK